MTEELTPSVVKEQFLNDPEHVKRTIQELLNNLYRLISIEDSDDVQIAMNTARLNLYEHVFSWDTKFEIEGRYQIPYSINVDFNCKDESQFKRILEDGFAGELETMGAGSTEPFISFEEADLYGGDFDCLKPSVLVQDLALKEEN
tara:strand:- start:2173 stop:2607 length:435 start_codon:yes stop_codon:yes gene_type:complete